MSPSDQYGAQELNLSSNMKLKITDKIYDTTVFRHQAAQENGR